MKKIGFVILTFVLVVFCFSFNANAQLKVLTGFEGGSYYQMGNDIKDIVDPTIEVSSSDGNYTNFNHIKRADMDVVFLQYDVLYAGSVGFEELKKIKNIRLLLPLGHEEIHLVTKKSRTDINTLEDLKKMKVGVGSRNQGTSITARFIKEFTKIKWVDVQISFDDAFQALMTDKVDAFFFVGSQPVSKLNNLKAEYKDSVKLVTIDNAKLERVYSKAVIKAGTYSWQTEDVTTYAVRYALAKSITNETQEDIVAIEKLLKDIKANITKLRSRGHQSWKDVDFDFSGANSKIHDVSRKLFL